MIQTIATPDWELGYIGEDRKRPEWSIELGGGILELKVFRENKKWRGWITGQRTIILPYAYSTVEAAKAHAIKEARTLCVNILSEMVGL